MQSLFSNISRVALIGRHIDTLFINANLIRVVESDFFHIHIFLQRIESNSFAATQLSNMSIFLYGYKSSSSLS